MLELWLAEFILSDLTSILRELREMSLGFPDINPISVFFSFSGFFEQVSKSKRCNGVC